MAARARPENNYQPFEEVPIEIFIPADYTSSSTAATLASISNKQQQVSGAIQAQRKGKVIGRNNESFRIPCKFKLGNAFLLKRSKKIEPDSTEDRSMEQLIAGFNAFNQD